jgi:predicted DNA-binding protein (UPF0251 family)
VDYGYPPEEVEKLFEVLRVQIPFIGQREVAKESGVSRRTIAGVVGGKTARSEVAARLLSVVVRKTEIQPIGTADKTRRKANK